MKPRKGHITPRKHRKGNLLGKWRGPKRRKIEILEKKKRRWALFLVIISFSIFLKGNIFLGEPSQVEGVEVAGIELGIEERMLGMVNVEREKVGVHPLILSEKLMMAAQRKAEDMIERDYWAHVAPDGTEPWYFIIQSGYEYVHAGENLYREYGIDVTDGSWDEWAVEMWMISSSHRQNMLEEDFNEMGIGRAGDIIVHHFGRRKLLNIKK